MDKAGNFTCLASSDQTDTNNFVNVKHKFAIHPFCTHGDGDNQLFCFIPAKLITHNLCIACTYESKCACLYYKRKVKTIILEVINQLQAVID